MKTEASDAVVGKGKGWPRTRTCDDCGTKYSATGPRSTCPKCNPKTVSGKDWGERTQSEKPRGVDRTA